MKVVKYRVKVSLTRVGSDIEAEISDQRERLSSDADEDFSSKRVVTLSSQLSQENDRQVRIAKASMSALDEKKDVYIIMSYIE